MFNGFQRVLEEFSANMRTCGGGGKIKGDAIQVSHKLERGCQLGFKGFHRFNRGLEYFFANVRTCPHVVWWQNQRGCKAGVT